MTQDWTLARVESKPGGGILKSGTETTGNLFNQRKTLCGASLGIVQAYPGSGGKWPVSTDGGDEPRWSGNGRELFYIHPDTMLAVDVKTTPTFGLGTSHMLFKGKYERPGAVSNFAITPDGQKFVMLKKQADSSPLEVDVVVNWAKELQK